MNKVGSDSVVSACTKRVSAIQKNLGAKDEVFVNGVPMKAADLAKAFQNALDTRAAAVTAKGEYKTALVARNSAEETRLTTDAALQPYILQRFGPNSPEAHDFGYAARKVTEKSAVTKAKAALLNKATREARGTKSQKEKEQIKGTLSPEAASALAALAGETAAVAPVPSAAPSVAPATNGAAVNGAAHS